MSVREQTIKEKFHSMLSREDVSEILGIKDASLRYFLYGLKTENLYSTFKIPKDKNNSRTINAPIKELKNIQRKLMEVLNEVYPEKVCAYGFVRGKNILQNAQNHTKKRLVLNIDLKDFFNHIHFGRIKGMLICKQYSIGDEAANVIAHLACYKGLLPQGAPSSPILTNMICRPMDTQLTNLAKKYKMIYTRYADDITISSDHRTFPEQIVYKENEEIKVGIELEKVISDNGFVINYDKLKLRNNSSRQEVTGLVTNKIPNIKREYIRQTRAILHECRAESILQAAINYVNKGYCKNRNIISNLYDEEKEAETVDWFKLVLTGRIGFIKEIRGNENLTFLKYAKQLNEVFKETVIDVTQEERWLEEINSKVFILEGKSNQATGFIIKNVGMITSHHIIEKEVSLSVMSSHYSKLKTIITSDALYKNDSLDYVIYEFQCDDGYEFDNLIDLKIGQAVKLIGYPNYINGNSPEIIESKIKSKVRYLGSDLYTVDTTIMHGFSGGVVLNRNSKVIGLVKAGINSPDERNSRPCGFIAIKDIIADIKATL